MKNNFQWVRKALCFLLAMAAGAGICLSVFGILLSPESGTVERYAREQFEEVLGKRAKKMGEKLVMCYDKERNAVPVDFYRIYLHPRLGSNDLGNQAFQTGVGPILLGNAIDYVLCINGHPVRNVLRYDFSDYAYHFQMELVLPLVRVVRMPPDAPRMSFEAYQREPDGNFPEVKEDVQSFSYVEVRVGKDETQFIRVDCIGATDYEVSIALTRAQAERLMEDLPQPSGVVRLLHSCSMEFWAMSLLLNAAMLGLALWQLARRAGVGAEGEIHAAGFNRLPLEAAVIGTWLICHWLRADPFAYGPVTDRLLECAASEAMALTGRCLRRCAAQALGAAALLTAFCAQYREGIWWENSLCCRGLRWAREHHLADQIREMYGMMMSDDDEDLDEDFDEDPDMEESAGTEQAKPETWFRKFSADDSEDDYVDVEENEPCNPE